MLASENSAVSPTDEKLEKLMRVLETEAGNVNVGTRTHSPDVWEAIKRRDSARAALRERFEEAREQSHRLAMLALQSDRYVQDAEYREATDGLLAWSFPVRRASMKEQE